MADYVARYAGGVEMPVAAFSDGGQAMVCDEGGRLVIAANRSGFLSVRPHVRRWKFETGFMHGELKTAEEG